MGSPHILGSCFSFQSQPGYSPIFLRFFPTDVWGGSPHPQRTDRLLQSIAVLGTRQVTVVPSPGLLVKSNVP